LKEFSGKLDFSKSSRFNPANGFHLFESPPVRTPLERHFQQQFCRDCFKSPFQPLQKGNSEISKTLKVLNCLGSGDLAGGGGFSTKLSPAKKIYQHHTSIII
jgi:hypothetical protein